MGRAHGLRKTRTSSGDRWQFRALWRANKSAGWGGLVARAAPAVRCRDPVLRARPGLRQCTVLAWVGAPPPPPQRARVGAGVGRPPHGLGLCIWMYLVNGTGNSPSPGRPTPGVVKQDKSSGGSVDTTKTRAGPQRVRMSSGERPLGAAKGKQPDAEALCQTLPPRLKILSWGKMDLVRGGMSTGHLWYTDLRVPDPLPPPQQRRCANNSVGLRVARGVSQGPPHPTLLTRIEAKYVVAPLPKTQIVSSCGVYGACSGAGGGGGGGARVGCCSRVCEAPRSWMRTTRHLVSRIVAFVPTPILK